MSCNPRGGLSGTLVLVIAVVIVSRALSCILESINELYMLFEEDVAEIVVADVNHDSLSTAGILWQF
jgi:hypothetical protein